MALVGDFYRFQSTLPLRGATPAKQRAVMNRRISIHAPLTGSDIRVSAIKCYICDFNPRSPYGERPVKFVCDRGVSHISIHAPLTGSDPASWTRSGRSTDFNPRSPYGERPYPASPPRPTANFNPRSPYGERLSSWSFWIGKCRFQSTLPLRGAT